MDELQFSQAVANHQDSLYVIAFHYCKDRFDAEDAVQNAFLQMFKAKAEFESTAHLKYWLIRVTINECKKILRMPWKKRTVPMEEVCGELHFEQPEESQVFLAVMALPKNDRLVVHLYYYEGYSVREIAETLGRRETTVQTQLMRARQKLKKTLREVWQDE